MPTFIIRRNSRFNEALRLTAAAGRRKKLDIRRYEENRDYERIHSFLTDAYRENGNMTCWLPARFDDLVTRIDTLAHEERGRERSSDYIFMFEQQGEIAGIGIPDGASFNCCIRNGREEIFPEMLRCAEKELLPLFERQKDGSVDFLAVCHDKFTSRKEELTARGYHRDRAGDYDNVLFPLREEFALSLPEGYRHDYGENLDEHLKAKACHYGFHPSDDDGVLTGPFREGELSYQARKKSRFYPDSFESLILTDGGDICSYSFCYVDKNTGTGFIEPVCTREKYRRKGLCTQMLYGIFARLKEQNIEKCFVNSFDWRKKVYNSAGFQTIDSIGFWRRKIR